MTAEIKKSREVLEDKVEKKTNEEIENRGEKRRN